MPVAQFDRIDQGLYSYTQTETEGFNPPQSPPYESPTIQANNGCRRTLLKTWARTPGYFSIRADDPRRGFFNLPMNDYWYEYTKIETKSREVKTFDYKWLGGSNYDPLNYRQVTYHGDTSATIFGAGRSPSSPGSAPFPVHDTAAIDWKAKNKSLLEMKDQKVNIVQAFAEREQVVRMMTSTLYRFVGAVRSLKRGDLRGAARSLNVSASRKRGGEYRKAFEKDPSKAVSQGWLELQYGWKPFLSDIYGAAEITSQKAVRELRNRMAKKQWDVQRTKFSSVGQYGLRLESECVSRYMVKYTCWYATDEVEHSLSQLGLTNPLTIAWELTPFSFVVDWFIPIGNYINSFDATKGLKFLSGCRTTFQEITFTSKALSGSDKALGKSVQANNETLYKRIVHTREKINSFPTVSLPPFKDPRSLVHFANALSLAVVLFKGK